MVGGAQPCRDVGVLESMHLVGFVVKGLWSITLLLPQPWLWGLSVRPTSPKAVQEKTHLLAQGPAGQGGWT